MGGCSWSTTVKGCLMNMSLSGTERPGGLVVERERRAGGRKAHRKRPVIPIESMTLLSTKLNSMES
jgi:hypothetical protein